MSNTALDRLKALRKETVTALVEQTTIAIPEQVEQVELPTPSKLPSKISEALDKIKLALDGLSNDPLIPNLSEQLMIVQKELQSTEYLADVLEPQDIGLLVKAVRSKMKEDILLLSATKTKKSTAVVSASDKQLALSTTDDDLDDTGL